MKYFYIETDRGCGIRIAPDLETATAEAVREAGTYGDVTVALATKQNIAWVKCMGGHVPDLAKARSEQ